MSRTHQIMLLAAVLIAASACDASEEPGTVLDLGQSHIVQCIPAPSNDSVVIGDIVLQHRGEAPVEIIDISLVQSQEMILKDALLVPLTPGDALVGLRYLSDQTLLPSRWLDRTDAVGAIVHPAEEWNLVLVIDSHSEESAFAKATRVFYEDVGGSRYWQDTPTSIVISVEPCEVALKEAPLRSADADS